MHCLLKHAYIANMEGTFRRSIAFFVGLSVDVPKKDTAGQFTYFSVTAIYR